jgi:hypothetical protein
MACRCHTNQLKPLTLTKQEAYRYVGIPSLVQDWLYAARRAKPGEEYWVRIAQQGGQGRETRIDRESIDRAYKMFLKGRRPPRIPSRGNRVDA